MEWCLLAVKAVSCNEPVTVSPERAQNIVALLRPGPSSHLYGHGLEQVVCQSIQRLLRLLWDVVRTMMRGVGHEDYG